MNLKTLIPVISIISVLVMFVWSYLAGSWEHSWLAVFAGGCLITVLMFIEKGKEKDGDKDEK